MGLETGTGIGDLVPTNPLSTDAVSAGDDHIRLIKTVMQSITGNFRSLQVFNASGTWTRPANIKKILVYLVGGGGGGNGGGAAGGHSGSGGSSGAITITMIDVTAIASAPVTIGAGGNGGASSVVVAGNLGTSGGITTFSSLAGSMGGQAGTVYYVGGVPQAPGASTGHIIFTGENGQHGNPPAPNGSSFGGRGGGSGGVTTVPAPPNSGGGGGGGDANVGTGGAGTAGGSGFCFILEFGW